MNYFTILILLTIVGLIGKFSIYKSPLDPIKKKAISNIYSGAFLITVSASFYIYNK